MSASALPFTTGTIKPELAEVLLRLKEGQRVRITQTVRVGSRTWTAVVSGTFRRLDSLVTGISTHRLPKDDIIVPTLHFLKDNQELSSVSLDENSRLEILDNE